MVYPYLQLVKLPTPAVRVAGLRNLRTGCPVCLGLFGSSVTMSSACGVASLRLCVYKTDSRPHFQNTWEESNKSTLLFLSLWLHHQIPGLTPKVELKATTIRLHKCDGKGSNWAACSTEGSKAMAPTAPQTPGTPPQPDDEHTHGRTWWVGHLQFSRTMGLAPEATHPLQGLATMQGKVKHSRLLSGMWWLRKVARILLLCKHS